ncbi:MAG: adenylate/guanylate cyclase domain-containing protein [Deltaproteobacteria bacterium]|nr:MAG: adenylate/guanylate cyclase domain-containing protein [Deltaproteobacteria bacterium]
MQSRVLTIMITDIKGFTERTSKTSREEMHKLLNDHESLLLPLVAKFRGTLVKTMGDAFMVTFESPTNAVLCAVMMQDKLCAFNEKREEEDKIQIRIALNAGEVEIREGDVFGEAVNTTARIEGVTEANEIYFSESVYLSMNKAEVPTSEVGLHRFKGIPEPVKLYRVIQDRESEKFRMLIEQLKTSGPREAPDALPAEAAVRPVRGFRPRLLPVLIILVLIGIAAAILFPQMNAWRVKSQKKTVLEALRTGDFGLARSRADKIIEQFPKAKEAHEAVYAVIEAEARKLKQEGKYDGALALLEDRKKERAYLVTDEIEKEVLLAKGAVYAEKNNYNISSAVYRHLLDRFGEDEQVLKETVKHMGYAYQDRPTSIGVLAAYRFAERSTGALDELMGGTLLNGYLNEQPFSEYTKNIRAILAERYPPALESAREELTSRGYERRLNSYYLLKEAGVITAEEELRYHFDNLRLLNSSYQKVGRESIAYLREAAKGADWLQRKEDAGIGTIEEIALISWSDYQGEVSQLLAEVFFDEIEPTVMKWWESDEEQMRANAFQILELAGRLDKVDEWKFHAKTLAGFDARFMSPYVQWYLQKALDFYKKHAGTKRAGEARKALAAGRDYVKKQIAVFKKEGKDWFAEQAAKKGLARIEEALAVFGKGK